MSYYPRSNSEREYITYPVGPVVDGLSVTSGGSANTKGAFTQLIASTPFTCNSVIINIVRTVATTGLQYLVDIAVGDAGSEVVVVPDLLAEGTNTATSLTGHGLYVLPLTISTGSRISVRCACSTATQNVFVSMTLIKAGTTPGISSFTALGINTSDSGATSIDPGGTSNTKGSYVEFSSSTAADYNFICPMVSLGGKNQTDSFTWAMDIALGSAGSEVVLIPDLRFAVACGSFPKPFLTPRSQSLLTYIPAGSRLSARLAASGNTATQRLLDVAFLVGTAPSESTNSGSSYGFA